MKCQRCPKQATLHITEVLAEERFEELHLCEDCAKKFLFEPVKKKPAAGAVEAPAAVGADDPGGKLCPSCGVKFVEFRNTGRLGCPHDYDSFREELVPLLESIHGDTKHPGKVPRRLPKAKAEQMELAQLRRQLQQAVDTEAYELAASLRDQIRQREEG
jgi:protein arginine kinase activator